MLKVRSLSARFLKSILSALMLCFGLVADTKATPFTIQSEVISHFDRLQPDRDIFGKLQFIGGLELTSPDNEAFGGLSGFSWQSADRFVAISDEGRYVSARLMLSGGRPIGIDQARMNKLPPVAKDKKYFKRDSEGLDIVGNRIWVSYEGSDRLAIYHPNSSGKLSLGKTLFPGKAIARLNKGNKGFESIAVGPDGSAHAGSVVILSENVTKKTVRGWILKQGVYHAFTMPQVDNLRPTDAAFLANGDLVIVERSFSFLGGLKIQLRRILAKNLLPGTISNIETLFRGDLRYELDNIEGLAVQSMPDGSSILTLISDDNFNSLQRTLLLQFSLAR